MYAAAALCAARWQILWELMSIKAAVEGIKWHKTYITSHVCFLCLFSAADHVLEGTLKLGGQEHFYLEPNGAIVIPVENDEYTLIASTQAPNKHQVRQRLQR